MKRIDISVIYVNYKSLHLLKRSIKSIIESRPDVGYEIIVSDNSKSKINEQEIDQLFDNTTYIANEVNYGYGKGINNAVKVARGKYLFILNPDTLIERGTIDKLIDFAKREENVGIVAPLLTNTKGGVFQQGVTELTPKKAIFVLSFLNRIFPNNQISREYFIKDWDHKSTKEVDVVPGAAFLIKRSLFEKVDGFDDKFFLYFEEFDLCKRLRALRKNIYIYPKAKIKHYWGASSEKEDSKIIENHFRNSRYYYFKKHFGLLKALAVEAFLRINLSTLLLFIILGVSVYLRTFKIYDKLSFGGETANNYLVIKNFIENREIPLIGPQTSHEWFSIGPLFYWLFEILLQLGEYHPVTGSIFFALMDVIFIYVSYRILIKSFNKYIALIAIYLISISPYWIIITNGARYNLIVIYLFLPFYYFLLNAIKKNVRYLFWVGLILGVMSNFFPSFLLLLPATFVVLLIYKKAIKLTYLKSLTLGFIIPNIPLIIYEFTNNFRITTRLILWVPYRIVGFLGIMPKNNFDKGILIANLNSFYKYFVGVIVRNDSQILFCVFATLFVYLSIYSYKKVKNYQANKEYVVLLVILIVSYFGLFIHGNPPMHYYYVILPIPIILVSILLSKIAKKHIFGKAVAILILAMITVINMRYLFSDKWFYEKHDTYLYSIPDYSMLNRVADRIIEDVKGGEFSIERVGILDVFEYNLAHNYRYLLWFKGNEPKDESDIVYTIYEYGYEQGTASEENIFRIGNIVVTKEKR